MVDVFSSKKSAEYILDNYNQLNSICLSEVVNHTWLSVFIEN